MLFQIIILTYDDIVHVTFLIMPVYVKYLIHLSKNRLSFAAFRWLHFFTVN